MTSPSARPRRVLVARLDSAGDVLVCGPAVRAVAAGADRTTLLCGPQGAAAGRLLPGVDEVLEWEAPWVSGDGPVASREHTDVLVALVREVAPDEAVVLTSFHQSPLPLALLLRLAGVPRVSGASVDAAGSLLDVRLVPGEDFPEDQPEPLRALGIAAAAGFTLPTGDDGLLRVVRPPDVGDLVGHGPYVVVHPGASVPSRAWPADHHRALVALLHERGLRPVVTGGPAERDLTRRVAGGAPRGCALDLGGRTDLRTLSGVLAGAGVVVTGNTGPAHLAAAVGTPVVSLFSPVVPAERWAPFGVPVTLLGDQHAPCRASRAQTCPVPGHPCLAGVRPEAALTACLELLGGSGSVRPHRVTGARALAAPPAEAEVAPSSDTALSADTALDLLETRR